MVGLVGSIVDFKGLRTGLGMDVHALVPGRKLILGGVEIEHHLGLDGHSDADVLTHAIIDAILGAAGLGDIGQLFPETDPQFKNANSVNLLTKVNEKVGRSGFTIGNIDCTILAEEPKMSPYLAEMKKNLAASCHLAVTQVNIKATTMETMGFVGKKEGIGAIAVALLEK